ncbi:MAG: hypothetical protein ACNYPE_15595 [Candidatus Azotimanducaceae bacterium WSBS_2022_MAG_OTU7]
MTKTKGLPAVTRNNQLYILAKQSQIYIGDIISTDERSTVSLALVSGQTIDIPPQTRWLVIDVTTNGVDYQSSSSLAQGAFQVKGPGTTPHEFIIRTALAELQTLAEHFWLGYHKGGNAGLTVVAMAGVPVAVRNRNGAITLRAPLQTTTVAPGVAPQNIVTWSEQKLQNTIDYYQQLQSLAPQGSPANELRWPSKKAGEAHNAAGKESLRSTKGCYGNRTGPGSDRIRKIRDVSSHVALEDNA